MSLPSLTKSGLDRFHRVMSGYVDRGDVPGMVALVSRGDDVHIETLGTMAVGGSEPMKRDTIFRVASITKPVTAVAAMILVEECKLRLDDPVDCWLPELANRQVLKSLSSPLYDTVPANRAITVRDLLTYRMGIGSIMAIPDTYPIQKLIRELKIGGDGPPRIKETPATEEWIKRLGTLPLIAQPGERWMYQVSADVLGVLISRVAGKSLGTFMWERIFEPLRMKDTGFNVLPDKEHRLPPMYTYDQEAKQFNVFDDAATSEYLQAPAFESGGGGLVSTADDYLAFSRMMLYKGVYGGTRILSRASVELMASDQLTPQQREGSEIFFGDNLSWGLGMSVSIKRDKLYNTVGRFGWDGGFGTSAYIDPAEDMIGILLTQRMMDSPEPPPLYNDFWTTAYAAME